MRALVVGADGFAGRWLVRHLAESGDEVHGVAGPRFTPPLPHAVGVVQADVRDAQAMTDAVRSASPDVLYFLAGVSDAPSRESADAAAVTVAGTENALRAAAAAGVRRLLLVSSSQVYGDTGPAPVSENAPLHPLGSYAAAKVAAEATARRVAPELGLELVVVRPFNHTGPGQRDVFVVPALAARVAGMERTGERVLGITNGSSVRDFSDVRDVVRAYRLLAMSGVPGEIYNVASGRGTSVAELAATLIRLAGLDASIEDVGDGDRSRDPGQLVGEASRARALGWEPRIPLETTLTDVLAEARSRLAG
jgi:GDP-4-dehydro-6-deoxy-D-mannose reductase